MNFDPFEYIANEYFSPGHMPDNTRKIIEKYLKPLDPTLSKNEAFSKYNEKIHGIGDDSSNRGNDTDKAAIRASLRCIYELANTPPA